MGYLQLDKVTVGAGGASSVTFSGLPDAAGDLEVYLSIKSDYVGDILAISTNETGSYRTRGFTKNNTTSNSVQYSTAGYLYLPNMVADTTSHTDSFSSMRMILWNYATNQRMNGWIQGTKMIQGGITSTHEVMPAMILTTQNTNTITELTFDLLGGTIQEGSTFTLFHLTH